MDNFSFTTFVWTKPYLESILFEGKHRIIHEPHIRKSFQNVDRAHFIPDKHRVFAYEDKDVDIGYGQKLYKPTTSAKLLNFLSPKVNGNYLIIGAGSGYLSTILGTIAGNKGKVVALERILMMLDFFQKNLKNYPHLEGIVEPVFKDGSKGYPGYAPYDGILYTGALDSNPIPVISQLKIGGNMVVPRSDSTVRIMNRVDKTNWSEKIYKDYLYFDPIMEGIE